MNSFLAKSSLAIAVIALILLTPFTIYNFMHGRHILGASSVVAILMLAGNAWLYKREQYKPLLTLTGLAPAIIIPLAFAYQDQGMVGALWSYPAVILFYFTLPLRQAILANVALLAITIPQALLVIESALVVRITVTLFTVSIVTAITMNLITLQHNRLEKLAVTDPLTGLYNRSLLAPTLENAVHQNRRLDIPMTLITLDLDHFKSINDSFGHAAGDRVLSCMADVLNMHLRQSDKIFRVGGEEFVALLYDAIADHGLQVANKLRSIIEEHPFLPEHIVTASIGVATLQPGEDWVQWAKRGDDNLYKAKLAGRNQVIA